MKEAIMAVMQDLKDGVTFVELGRRVPGFLGDNNWLTEQPGQKNLVLWSGISELAIAALQQLIVEGHLACDRYDRTLDLYKLDGEISAYPLIDQFPNDQTKQRWVPVELSLAIPRL